MRICVSDQYANGVCVAAVGSENLLAGLGKCHPGKGRGEGFRVHLAARALQVIILPCLRVRRLKPTTNQAATSSNLSWTTILRTRGAESASPQRGVPPRTAGTSRGGVTEGGKNALYLKRDGSIDRSIPVPVCQKDSHLIMRAHAHSHAPRR